MQSPNTGKIEHRIHANRLQGSIPSAVHMLPLIAYLQQCALFCLAVVYGERLSPIEFYQAVVLVDQSNEMQVHDILQGRRCCVTFLSSCLEEEDEGQEWEGEKNESYGIWLKHASLL